MAVVNSEAGGRRVVQGGCGQVVVGRRRVASGAKRQAVHQLSTAPGSHGTVHSPLHSSVSSVFFFFVFFGLVFCDFWLALAASAR